MKRPLDLRIVTAIVDQVPGFPNPIEAELKSVSDLVLERIAAAEAALAKGEQPSSTDATIRAIHREMTHRPLQPPMMGVLPATARYFLHEVGEVVAQHPQVLDNLMTLADELRSRDRDEDHIVVQQARELLTACDENTLPDELDEAVRTVWGKCWNGPLAPAPGRVDMLGENAVRSAASVFDPFAREEQIGLSVTPPPVDLGGGVRVEYCEGDTPEVDPLASRAARGDRPCSMHPIPTGW